MHKVANYYYLWTPANKTLLFHIATHQNDELLRSISEKTRTKDQKI